MFLTNQKPVWWCNGQHLINQQPWTKYLSWSLPPPPKKKWIFSSFSDARDKQGSALLYQPISGSHAHTHGVINVDLFVCHLESFSTEHDGNVCLLIPYFHVWTPTDVGACMCVCALMHVCSSSCRTHTHTHTGLHHRRLSLGKPRGHRNNESGQVHRYSPDQGSQGHWPLPLSPGEWVSGPVWSPVKTICQRWSYLTSRETT